MMTRTFALFVALVGGALTLPSKTSSGSTITISYNDGTNATYKGDEPALARRGDELTKVCVKGVWTIHFGQYYTHNEQYESGSTQILPYLEETCETDLISSIASARIVGFRPDPTVPSVTFYNEVSLQGGAITYTKHIPAMLFEVHSLVTVGTQVEFFASRYYEGDSYCIDGGHGCVEGVCWTWSSDYDLPFDLYEAQSAKIGCSTGAKRIRQKKVGSPIMPVTRK